MNAYNGLLNDIDYWKMYIRKETVAVIYDVWEDAEDDMEEFLDDWR